MNTRSINQGLIRQLSIIVAGLGLTCTWAASGVEKTNPPSSTSQSATNSSAKPAPIEIPVSQFSIPTSISEGRNPFFPDSLLAIKNQVAPTNTQGKPIAVALQLQGISGTPTKRFARIVGKTFEEGEEGPVTVGRSKVQVRCLKIRDDGVTIEIDGNRQELKLRPGL